MPRLAVAALAAAVFAAPQASRPSSIFTEAEFLSVLDDGHPALAVRREPLELARAGALAARTLHDPALEVAREDPSGATEQTDVTLAWQLPSPSRSAAVRSAERAVAAGEARLADERLALRLELRRVYAAWAVAQERVRLFAAHAARLSRLAARERERAQRGEISGLEARRLELEAAAFAARLALAEAEATTARAAARAFLPALSPDSVPALPDLPPLPSPDAVTTPEHPRLVALEEELEAARLARRAASRILDAPELRAGWQRQETGTASFDGAIFGFSWPLPLLDRKRAERAGADARLRATEARLEVGRREIEAARAGVASVYAHLAAAAAQGGQTSDGGSMIEAAVKAFRLGEATLTDLLDTLRAALEAEEAALDLHRSALDAHRELERLAGHPLELADGTTPEREEP